MYLCVYLQCLGNLCARWIYVYVSLFFHVHGNWIGFYGLRKTHIIQFNLTFCFERLIPAMQTYCNNKIRFVFILSLHRFAFSPCSLYFYQDICLTDSRNNCTASALLFECCNVRRTQQQQQQKNPLAKSRLYTF